MRFRTIESAWNDFWLKPIEPTSIALYRILFGLVTLAYGAVLAPDWHLWFSDSGTLSLATAVNTGFKPHINILRWLPPGYTTATLFFYFFMFWAALLTIGLFTRTSLILTWLCLVSLYNRNLTISNGATILMVCLSFWLMFSHAGGALSVDRLWRILRGKETEVLPKYPPWGQRLVQIQLCVVYFFTVYMKMVAPQWIHGVAIYYVARDDLWRRFGVPFADYLWVCKLYTWGTMLVESSLALLIWVAGVRYWILLLGVLFHLGMEFSLNIPWFQWITPITYVTFIEPAHLTACMEALRGWIARRFGPPAMVFIDGTTEPCVRGGRLLKTADIFRRTQVVEDSAAAGQPLLIKLSNGTVLSGIEAIRWLAWRLPILWWAALPLSLPGINFFGKLVYLAVSRNKFLLTGARRPAPAMDETAPGVRRQLSHIWNFHYRPLVNIFLGFHLLILGIWLFPPDYGLRRMFERPMAKYLSASGLMQSWSMFAPRVRNFNEYFEAEITFKDGSVKPWSFPRTPLMSVVERIKHVNYHQWMVNFYSAPRISKKEAAWDDSARYIARQHNTDPNNPPVKVVFFARRGKIEPPSGKFKQPIPKSGTFEYPDRRWLHTYSLQPEDLVVKK